MNFFSINFYFMAFLYSEECYMKELLHKFILFLME